MSAGSKWMELEGGKKDHSLHDGRSWRSTAVSRLMELTQRNQQHHIRNRLELYNFPGHVLSIYPMTLKI